MHTEDSDALGRETGAPRLIDWTGERCVPWAPDVQVVYEHLHRYLWAARLLEGRRVLDLACGEGFGAAILARSAATVVAVDIDRESVEHARLNYESSNLTFAVADARDLSGCADGSFGAVVAFEMIEHVEEQDRVLSEIHRVLAPNGVLVISTPDREAYRAASGGNPFHVRELRCDELVELLGSRFANARLWGQRTITGSAMAALGDRSIASPPAAESFFVERAVEAWRVAPGLAPVYILAVASNAELPPASATSTLGDGGLELLREAETRAAQAARRAIEAGEQAARELRQELASLRARAMHDAHLISSLDAALDAARSHINATEGSVSWRLVERGRLRAFAALGGQYSRRVGVIHHMLELLEGKLHTSGRAGRRAGVRPPATMSAQRHDARIAFPEFEHRDVSIVIAVHAHAELTRAALESVRDNTPYVSYEVIVVDDAADAETKQLLRKVHGAAVIVNEANLGYLRSVQRGAAAAHGRWLVLCNNDIEVQPGWLGALLDCGESQSDIAIVAPKFVYPDGSIAEAGAIIWRDGTGVNYGRGEDPGCCHYEYRREIDYGSAAALMVKTDFWRQVGGFDNRFAPMYYEDTDLCFQARARGLRVLFEPRARVIHAEGATAGVDPAAGHKRHQERNRPRFVDKWREQLNSAHQPSDRADLWAAANLRRDPHVLVVDHRVPAWDRDSGSLRMRGMLETLVRLGCHVTFAPDNLIARQPYTRELQRAEVEVLYGIDASVELARIGPSLSLVILSRPHVASQWLELVREHAGGALVAYDTVDLHWLREARRAARHAGAGREGIVLSPKAAAMRELELALIRATDVTLVVSESERVQVTADVPDAAVRVVPNVNELRLGAPVLDGREGVLFVGGFEHPPNVDAVLALVRDVMPPVWRALGDVGVRIVGADPPPEIQALASPLVEVTGWVQDLDPLLDAARTLVAPLSYGAGLKGKVTQALAAGLPVVTTPIGAEGLDAVDGEQLLVGETPDELADRVIAVLRNDDLWQRLSRAGQERAGERCSPAVMTATLEALLDEARRAHDPERTASGVAPPAVETQGARASQVR